MRFGVVIESTDTNRYNQVLAGNVDPVLNSPLAVALIGCWVGGLSIEPKSPLLAPKTGPLASWALHPAGPAGDIGAAGLLEGSRRPDLVRPAPLG